MPAPIFGRQMPTLSLGYSSTNGGGALAIGAIGTSSDPYSTLPSGVPGYTAGGTPLLVIYANGDTQRPQGLGIPGWVTATE